jgi:tetratricopeptide (TPR) repeat protein
MMFQRRVTGDYDAALKLGQEALDIAHTLGDRSTEMVATYYLGETHLVWGKYSEAAKLFEQSIGLIDGKLRTESFGTAMIPSAACEVCLPPRLPPSGGSTRRSDMAKPDCGSPRRPIIHSHCSSGCSISAGRTSVAATSRARSGS